jgi:protein-disulfide isomerase
MRVLAAMLALAAWAGAQDRVVATIDGQPVRESEIKVQGQARQIEQQIYEARVNAVEQLITRRLLEKAAAAYGGDIQALLKHEVDDKMPEPTPGEVEAFYLGQRNQIRQPLESVREQLARNLKTLRANEARQKYVAALREKAKVEILLEPPRAKVEVGRSARKGPAAAPVTIVEFSDFQCPYCKRAAATVNELVKKYGEQVSVVFKDLPLSIHPQARAAAEAARCAGEQGRFWEYHDALFGEASFSGETWMNLAERLKLDKAQFKQCVDSGKYRAAVEEDERQAQELGIESTPAFFINGVALTGAQPIEEFSKLIDRELARRR